MRDDPDAYDAVVYDLDGTLVRLAVDWDAVAREATELFAEAGVDVTGADLWEMLDVADERGLRQELESLIRGHECDGARTSSRLPLADRVAEHAVAPGVCSLNSEDACRVALETHELVDHADAVVGRDSVATRKPDPEPLLETLRRLGVDPDAALFVGDSPRDELTAERAGVAFRYVEDGPSEY